MKIDDATVLQRYKRCHSDSTTEHDRIVKETADFYAAYGLNSIGGRDFADLQKVWGDNPPEIGMMLSNVNTFWGELVSSRRDPTFPGFDQSPQDEVTGEMLTMALKAWRRWAGSDAVDEEVLTDCILTGYGFGEQFLETEQRPPFRPVERHVSLSDVWFDVGASSKNLKDMQEVIRRHRYSIDEAAARFRDHADSIRALSASGEGTGPAVKEGARALGGPAISVSVSSADGVKTTGASRSKRLREVAVDDFQFICFEELVQGDIPGVGPFEGRAEDYEAAMAQIEEAMAASGQPFDRPPVLPFTAATWYRARILAQSAVGEPLVLQSAEPIPGNQRLVKVITGYPERYMEGDELRTRFFGFGRVLLGMQRLVSVAIRIYIEQEARRNRGGGDVETDAFESESQYQAWLAAKSQPGAYGTIPAGSFDKIHHNAETISPHSNNMQGLFKFFSVDLVGHMLGISDQSRGTYMGDQSAKLVATMQESAVQMQARFTSAFTDYLAEGAVTMARLMLLKLDAEDIDRLLGSQPLRDGITGQKDPETGELVALPVLGPDGEPEIGPDGEPVPMTIGHFLKDAAGEIFDQDVGFGLRPSAASERMAHAMLWTQHGFLGEIAKLLPPEAGEILAPAVLKGSFAEGTVFADTAEKLEALIQKLQQKRAAEEQMQTEDGWLQFITGLAQTDFEKAGQLMTQAAEAVSGPQTGETN